MRMQFLSLALAAGAVCSGCAPPESTLVPGESTFERIQRTGAVKVGFANEAPYAYLDSSDRRLTGEAPEILRLVMQDLGVNEVEGVMTEFGALIPGLKAGRFDIIAAGMYITPQRCEQIAFTNPTYAIGEAFVVAAGNPKRLHSYGDVIKNPEIKLGVVAGTVERGYARDTGIPDAQVVVFPDPPSAIAGVTSGRIDAYAGTSLTVADLLRKAASDKLERADPFTDPVIDGKSVRGYGAFGLRPEDADLLNALNDALGGFIGTDRHRATVGRFGFSDAELPGTVTAAELCGDTPQS